ncbi:MAG: outer membrane beta-barrel family protein [Saprospiraceae bacterium]
MAQPPAGGNRPAPPTIVGQVLDVNSNLPVEYATVTLLDTLNNTVVDGTTTDVDGKFVIRVRGKSPVLEISFIGYEPLRITDIKFVGEKADLGKIQLKSDAEVLDEVVVRADKSTTEFRLDKRVFNVGQDLSSTGASALEVLNNVPSVNVDIEGTITLRGSGGVQVLIDGRPSVLADEGNALGTITADMIDKIEVVTNPSAKYEAEGTSGILNIILKKNEKKGLNGSITLNTGTPHNHSVGLSINNRTSKFNLFSQLGVGYKELPSDVENVNLDKLTGRTISSIGEEFRKETFYNFILGSDYYINERNVITLSGSVSYEVEDQPSSTAFTLTDAEDRVLSEWVRTEVTEATNPKFQYELKYKKDFEDNKDHVLLFSAIGNYFGKDQSSFFVNNETVGLTPSADQITETAFEEGKYTFNLDYTKPFEGGWTIETGAQYLANHVNNDFAVKEEENGEFVVNPGLTNVFDFNQNVLGLYGTTSYEGDKWGIKAGLRLENTDLTTILENTGETNNKNFNNLFPSFATSYKLTEGISFQAGYSRRIYRPRLWDLNPFFNIRNNFSIRAGNPDLLPEFTDSYEMSSIFIYDDLSFNITAYHRYTTDVIDRVSTFEDNVNIFMPFNIGTNRTTGLEANFKYALGKNITFNGDANYNLFTREGTFNDQVFDFTADQWSGKLTARLKVNKQLEIESTGRYISRLQTIQGVVSENLFADLGVRYKILDGRAVLNLSVRDLFASRIRENIIDQDDFSIYQFSQRGRFVTLGFSYGFGKGEAMEFKGGGGRGPGGGRR